MFIYAKKKITRVRFSIHNLMDHRINGRAKNDSIKFEEPINISPNFLSLCVVFFLSGGELCIQSS